MLGRKSAVGTEMAKLQSKILANHCYRHSLNLPVKDVAFECIILKDTIGTVEEICILVKNSPKRENLLCEIQENNKAENGKITAERNLPSTSLDKLCPTRWTVHVIRRQLITLMPYRTFLVLCRRRWVKC